MCDVVGGSLATTRSRYVDRRTTALLSAVAELTLVVPAPALDPAAASQRASVAGSRGDGTDPAAELANVDWGRAVRIRPVAQLAVAVRAPALDPAAAGQGAGVVESRGDGADPAAEPANVDRGRLGLGRPVAELAVVVQAPALDRTGAGQRAGVAGSRGDGAIRPYRIWGTAWS